MFDPTVGTGGFMFDSFEFVMQGVSQDGHWPGPKSHPDLAAWFKDYRGCISPPEFAARYRPRSANAKEQMIV